MRHPNIAVSRQQKPFYYYNLATGGFKKLDANRAGRLLKFCSDMPKFWK